MSYFSIDLIFPVLFSAIFQKVISRKTKKAQFYFLVDAGVYLFGNIYEGILVILSILSISKKILISVQQLGFNEVNLSKQIWDLKTYLIIK